MYIIQIEASGLDSEVVKCNFVGWDRQNPKFSIVSGKFYLNGTDMEIDLHNLRSLGYDPKIITLNVTNLIEI